ncbi:unnamed protein product [Schistocephalus solidus]|uniref:Reverse transcriptase domain-containing protein n=1 Tax=Schistocephalus solidus TaxID=70667 RepID=A0A183T4E5_SCHSO|nr:unnamed protein product [Schistocephalus solidus]
MDEIFVVIKRDQVLEFKGHLNAIFPDIQFTIEEEENNQLAFLYILVCCKYCDDLQTKVFRKAPNTTQGLSYNRRHPMRHKRCCGSALKQRLETHGSEPEDRVAELQYLSQQAKVIGEALTATTFWSGSVEGEKNCDTTWEDSLFCTELSQKGLEEVGCRMRARPRLQRPQMCETVRSSQRIQSG